MQDECAFHQKHRPSYLPKTNRQLLDHCCLLKHLKTEAQNEQPFDFLTVHLTDPQAAAHASHDILRQDYIFFTLHCHREARDTSMFPEGHLSQSHSLR